MFPVAAVPAPGSEHQEGILPQPGPGSLKGEPLLYVPVLGVAGITGLVAVNSSPDCLFSDICLRVSVSPLISQRRWRH